MARESSCASLQIRYGSTLVPEPPQKAAGVTINIMCFSKPGLALCFAVKVVIPAVPTVALGSVKLMADGLLLTQVAPCNPTVKLVDTPFTFSLFCRNIGVAAILAPMLSCKPVGTGYLLVNAVKLEPGYVATPTRSLVSLA